MKKLSIVILSFNTKELLTNCLDSLEKVRNEADFDVIVVDNGSTDGSSDLKGNFKLILNKSNLGFAKGNNKARKIVDSEYVLFLNSDTLAKPGAISETLRYLSTHEDVGAVTCKIVLPNGKLDKDSRRRFPTPWISFKRLFLKMGGEYWYSDVDENLVQEVDVIQGAFFMTREVVLNEVDWFDEDYFLNGEDIDLCWKIKNKGYKIVYYPKVSIVHLKKSSKGIIKAQANTSSVDAMEIFFRKRLWNNYPLLFDYFVITGIRLMKVLRKI